MSPAELRDIVIEALARVAPELDTSSLDGRALLRDQVDLDSMDFFNFVVALHDRLGIDIPEVDYAKLSSVDAIVAYLAAQRGSGSDAL